MQNDEPQPAWEQELRSTLGIAPPPNFGAWRQQNLEALSLLSNPVVAQPDRSHRQRLGYIAAAVALLVVLAFGMVSNPQVNRTAFAAPIPGVDQVQAVTWTTELYERVVSADGKRHWYERPQIQNVFQAPGRQKSTWLDLQGQPERIEIRDDTIGRVLELHPKTKTGVIRPTARQTGKSSGPFEFVGDALRTGAAFGAKVKSSALLKPHTVNGKSVNVVRLAIDAGTGFPDLNYHALFDAESKALVGVWSSQGNPQFNPWRIEGLDQPAEAKWSLRSMDASYNHNINTNPIVAETEFSLEAPPGYTIDGATRPEVSEGDLTEFLQVAAGLNSNRFPDQPLWYAIGEEVWSKPESERSTAEQAAIDLKLKLATRNVYAAPALVFEEQQAQPGTFRYVGAGHLLNDSEALLFWYKPVGQSKYRVVHCDLTVRDVAESELPVSIFR